MLLVEIQTSASSQLVESSIQERNVPAVEIWVFPPIWSIVTFCGTSIDDLVKRVVLFTKVSECYEVPSASDKRQHDFAISRVDDPVLYFVFTETAWG
jgi:hypothetical protein